MARYKATLETQLPPEEVFAYLGDFTNASEWDPSTVQAERVGEGPIGEGSEFRLVARFLGRDNAIVYRIVEYEAPTVVRLRGENATVVSHDRISIEAAAGGSRITYDAVLTLTGWLRLADPLLAVAFTRLGKRALAGMRAALARREAHMGVQSA